LGKKVFVVAGGFDIGYEPQINFGARIRPIRWFTVRSTFRLANLILPVSRYAETQLRTLIPGISNPVAVVYNAVRTDILDEEDALAPRRPIAMMISQGDSEVEIKRKGVDVFVEIARSTPDIEFRLIGLAARNPIVQRASKDIANLRVYPGFVSYDDVIVPTFKTAAAYLQPSVEEAFGVAIVEGMSCGCIPVVAPVAAIPEVVGDVGVYCDTLAEYQHALREAVHASAEQRLAVRRRSMQYTESVRRESILRAVC
jgi:glycosyltransferase involved in cell wall biosynthesis